MHRIKEEFWSDVKVPGTADSFNQELEKAGRVADLIELGILMAKDALDRTESCGGHFREESVELDGEQKGEAKRDDENFKFVSAWEWTGDSREAKLHKEELEFEYIELKQRSYK
jgi:succinate dehydrogenase / fumarate reductase flavoprotein subunit